MASGDRPGLVLHHPLPPLHSFTVVPLCLGANHGPWPWQQPALLPSLPLLQSYLHSSLLPKQLHTSHCSWLRHSHKPRVKEQLFSCQPSAVQRFPSSPHRNVLLLNPCTEQGAANEQDAGREQGFLYSQHKHSLAQLSVPAPRVGANG